jgi:hypothetical protein
MKHWANGSLIHSVLILCLGLSACGGANSGSTGGRQPPSAITSDGNRPTKQQDDLARFDALYRASQRLQADGEIGVSQTTLHQDLLQFATEVAVLRNARKSERENQIYERYASAVQAYSDTLTLWSHATGWEGRIAVEGGVVPIQKRYRLPLTRDSKAQVESGAWTSPAMEKSVVRHVLTIAGTELVSADNLLVEARNH